MSKILALAPRIPLPADTGAKIRTLSLLRQLGRKFHIHLVCLSAAAEDADAKAQLQGEGLEVTLVPHASSKLAYLNALAPNRPPIAVAKYASQRLGFTLANLGLTRQYLAVHCDHLHMAQYRACLPRLPWVLDEHNVEHQILERLGKLEKHPLRRWLVADQARRLRRFERQAVGYATKVLAVSASDAQVLRCLGMGTPIEVVPNGVDTTYFEASTTEPGSPDLVFTGSMDWWPNQDAAIYFAREILPLVRRDRPEARFVIVGRAPSANVSRLARGDASVEVTGGVGDVRPFLRRAAAVVVPLRVGGGTRLKILEAMAMGRAVVSTELGAEGIECTSGEQLLIAHSPRDFAAATLDLLGDVRRRDSIGRSARSLVAERYDWGSVGRGLLAAYETMLATRAQGSPAV